MRLNYKIRSGKLKWESIYDVLRRKKELPPPGQLRNQTQFIYTGLFFWFFLALVASTGGLYLLLLLRGFQKALPIIQSNLKPSKVYARFFQGGACRLKFLQDMTIEKVINIPAK
jgi:hypothetical protein